MSVSLLVLLGGLAIGGAPEGDALAEAGLLASRGQTAAAIDAYREALAELPGHPGVHYNLGTLHLEQRDLGQAVLHLLAAQRLAPEDEDIAFNLSVALAARSDKLAGVGPGKPWYETLGDAFPGSVVDVLLMVAFVLFWFGLALWPRMPWRAWRAATVTCGVFAMLGAGVVLSKRLAEDHRVYVVTVDKTDALKAPAADAAVAFEAHAALFGVEVGHEGEYLRLRLDNGVEAWFSVEAVSAVPSI